MNDEWVECVTAYDNVELSGVCLLDMNLGFDIVVHYILITKLILYGFENNCT